MIRRDQISVSVWAIQIRARHNAIRKPNAFSRSSPLLLHPSKTPENPSTVSSGAKLLPACRTTPASGWLCHLGNTLRTWFPSRLPELFLFAFSCQQSGNGVSGGWLPASAHLHRRAACCAARCSHSMSWLLLLESSILFVSWDRFIPLRSSLFFLFHFSNLSSLFKTTDFWQPER